MHVLPFFFGLRAEGGLNPKFEARNSKQIQSTKKQIRNPCRSWDRVWGLAKWVEAEEGERNCLWDYQVSL